MATTKTKKASAAAKDRSEQREAGQIIARETPAEANARIEREKAEAKERGERWRGKDTGCGKWLLRMYVSTNPVTKKKKYKGKIFCGTYAQAETELAKMIAKRGRGTDVAAGEQKLKDYMLSRYLPFADTHKASVTAQNLRVRMIKYVCNDAIGEVRLADLTTLDCDEWIQRLSKATYRGSLLQPSYVLMLAKSLKLAYKQARKWKLIEMNPVDDATMPSSESKTGGTPLTELQTLQLFEATANDRLHALWRLGAMGGTRHQEIQVFKWSDIDWDKKQITIKRVLTRCYVPHEDKEKAKAGAKSVAWKIKTYEGKNRGALRSFALSDQTLAALKAHKARQNMERLLAGSAWKDDDFIFTTETGEFLVQETIRYWWYKSLNRAGLPRVRVYDLRHTHATHLLQNGENPKAVAARLGHANTQMLLQVYGHVLPGADEKLASGAEDMLTRAAQKRLGEAIA